jgi:hypothetical protein
MKLNTTRILLLDAVEYIGQNAENDHKRSSLLCLIGFGNVG